MSRKSASLLRFTLALGLLVTALPGFTAVQSDAASRQSAASLDASIEVPAAVATALSEGARFVVTGVAASGEAVAITVSAVGTGVSFVVRVSAEAAERMALVAGVAVSVTVVAAGWLLSAGGEALCFIANDAARELIHTRRLDS
jgi:hypothetical protein